MTKYAREINMALRLITKKGFLATVRGAPVASDPVDGTGGSAGVEAQVQAVETRIDNRVFPETLIQSGDRQFIFAGDVERGAVLVDGDAEWAVRETQQIKPDNDTAIITKALISG